MNLSDRFLFIFSFILLPFFSILSDESNKIIDSYSVSLGYGNGSFSIPSIRPIHRAYADAWVSDFMFVPEYYRPVPFIPKQTIVTTESYKINLSLEKEFNNLLYLGIGLNYKNWNHTSRAKQTIRERILFKYTFYPELDPQNQYRIDAINKDTYLLLTEAYWFNLSLRFPLYSLYKQFGGTYLSLKGGIGSCVRGERCNLTGYSAGIGYEFKFIDEKIRPFFMAQYESIHQERPRLSIVIKESGIIFGIRIFR